MTIRSFFAVPLKSAVARRLADHADTLCSFNGDSRVRWSDSAGYHLTLCFLGELTLDQISTLEQQARCWFVDQPLFSVQLVRSCYLQVNPQQAVLAAQTDRQVELMQLQQRVASLVAKVGIKVEEADFHPHITLGRLPLTLPSEAIETVDTAAWPRPDLRIQVDSLVLYQSKLGEQGSTYTPLFDIPLSTSRSDRNQSIANA